MECKGGVSSSQDGLIGYPLLSRRDSHGGQVLEEYFNQPAALESGSDGWSQSFLEGL